MSKVIHEKMSGGQWVAALRKDPTLASKCEWEKLSGDDWRRLLKDCPQFADRCDWSQLSGDDWRRLLADQPQFCEHCDFGKLEAEGLLDDLLRCRPELANKCDTSGWDAKRWMEVLNLCPNNGELASQCDRWAEFPVDCVCGMLCVHPKLVESCPDSVMLKFRLGHWARLYQNSKQVPYVVDDRPHGFNDMTGVVVDRMRELGVVVDASEENEKAVTIGGFTWCCPNHWAEEYGSVFHRFAAAMPNEEKIKDIAENSAMNPQSGFLGRGSRFALDIPKHIQWLAALAADFAAMAAEAAVSAPEYAEEYSIIAQAAAYETGVLMQELKS